MESWIPRLAKALKSSRLDINVVITDWLSLAHQHYPRAVKSTRTVGKDIAHLLQTLQVRDSEREKKENFSHLAIKQMQLLHGICTNHLNVVHPQQEEYRFPVRKAHLIGYSLGAHISGFAGSYLGGSEKIGRITGKFSK